ncbi:MAG TPA: hypothetical protein VFW83_06365 [Bryobacteraceae bacterium]|nr:hypothetical protein [Bryobacteraceae bacterium]
MRKRADHCRTLGNRMLTHGGSSLKELSYDAVVLRFLWQASKGYRLRPWRSPYLLWRIETYWGLHASQITPKQFRGFVREHRRDLLRFLRWADRMRREAGA